jgi:DNA mismatch repair ATPase MutL
VAAAQWATMLVMHQTRRMLFMVNSHVAENPFHSECLKLVRKLREAPDQQLPHSVLLKRMKIDAKTFHELITTLEQQGDVAIVTQSTAGRPQRAYRLTYGVSGGERSG